MAFFPTRSRCHRLAVFGTALAFVCAGSLLAVDLPAPSDLASPPADAEVSSSGLTSKVLAAGTGTEPPGQLDIVEVHYTGWDRDGEVFDSTSIGGEPAGLPIDRIVPGLAEGLMLMVTGEKRRFWIPGALAFDGRENLPQGTVVYDVELLAVERRTPPPVPEHVAGPPDDAEVTKSGLAFKLLQAGSGSEHPRAASQVLVHYTGWQTNGQTIDSSLARGEPSSFVLREVIKGWTEGLQLMVVGEKRRFWIPEKLAYKGQRGKPKGMLVFDIELIAIEKR